VVKSSEPEIQDYYLWNAMKTFVWLKHLKNERKLRQEIVNFHLELESDTQELRYVRKSIGGFSKRLVCILELSGRNVDNKERRNYAWSKHVERLENQAKTPNTSSQSIVETSPSNSTVERIEVENVDNMVDLFLVE
jgi:hypothetical protein